MDSSAPPGLLSHYFFDPEDNGMYTGKTSNLLLLHGLKIVAVLNKCQQMPNN